MEHKYNNHSGEENFLFGKNKELPFVVPQDYFESLAARIIAKVEAANELNEFKTLSSIGKKPLFDVPEDYFNVSQNALEHKYELSQFKNLSAIPKVDFSKMESGYADKLSNKILNQEDELKDFKTLSSIPKKNEFEIKPEYFEKLENQVKEKYDSVNDSQQGRVITFFKAISNPKFAVAASIALLIGVSAIWYATRPESIIDAPGDCHTLACLEKNELLNEHNIRDFDEENLYDMVDVESLDKQLSDDSTSVTSDSIIK